MVILVIVVMLVIVWCEEVEWLRLRLVSYIALSVLV